MSDRRQISATLNRDLLDQVDQIVSASSGVITRSQIIDRAIEMFLTKQTASIKRRARESQKAPQASV